MTNYVNGKYRFSILESQDLETDRYLIHLPISSGEVILRIMDIEAYAKIPSPSLERLTDKFLDLITRIPIQKIDIDLPFVIRSRSGYRENGKPFCSVGQLSYNPVVASVKTERFSLEREPAFYACLPDDHLRLQPALASILESCHIDNLGTVADHSYVTIGRWKIKETFPALNLTLHHQAMLKNRTIRWKNEQILKACWRSFLPDAFDATMVLGQYLSTIAGTTVKNPDEYLKTVAFRHALREYYGPYIQAILYSGAKSENYCLNIVIDKEMIINGRLYLDGGVVYKVEATHFNTQKWMYPCSNFFTPDAYGNFEIKMNEVRHMFG